MKNKAKAVLLAIGLGLVIVGCSKDGVYTNLNKNIYDIKKMAKSEDDEYTYHIDMDNGDEFDITFPNRDVNIEFFRALKELDEKEPYMFYPTDGTYSFGTIELMSNTEYLKEIVESYNKFIGSNIEPNNYPGYEASPFSGDSTIGFVEAYDANTGKKYIKCVAALKDIDAYIAFSNSYEPEEVDAYINKVKDFVKCIKIENIKCSHKERIELNENGTLEVKEWYNMRTIDADRLERDLCNSHSIRGLLSCTSESDMYYLLKKAIDKQPTVGKMKKVEKPLDWIARNQSGL